MKWWLLVLFAVLLAAVGLYRLVDEPHTNPRVPDVTQSGVDRVAVPGSGAREVADPASRRPPIILAPGVADARPPAVAPGADGDPSETADVESEAEEVVEVGEYIDPLNYTAGGDPNAKVVNVGPRLDPDVPTAVQ